MIQNLPQTVAFIQKIEHLLGIELFLVGGAVRDLLLGKTTKDFDFTTATTPDEVENKIKQAGFKPYLLGKKYGTIGFKLETDLIEITTFRHEVYQPGSRKPEVGFHSDIKFDLSRRDLSINAMAISSKGEIIDYFEGQKDLVGELVRAVGDPNQRFTEDPLRMLRAIRFAGQYKFEIENQTSKAIKSNFWRLLDISKERWVMEMDYILALPDPSQALDLFKDLGLAQVVLPEILTLDFDFQKLHVLENFWQATKLEISEIEPNLIDQRWGALLFKCVIPPILFNFLQQNRSFGILGIENLEIEVKDFVNKIEIEQLLKAEFVAKLSVESALKIGRYLKFSNSRLKIISEYIAKNFIR